MNIKFWRPFPVSIPFLFSAFTDALYWGRGWGGVRKWTITKSPTAPVICLLTLCYIRYFCYKTSKAFTTRSTFTNSLCIFWEPPTRPWSLATAAHWLLLSFTWLLWCMATSQDSPVCPASFSSTRRECPTHWTKNCTQRHWCCLWS